MENKVTKKELETIREHQVKVNNALNEIGYLESRKHASLHELASVNQEVESYKSELEEKYGAININIENGTFEVIEQELEVVE